jgi:2-C-methyl-D-erythritol 4-phosphate cytidylyltransferase
MTTYAIIPAAGSGTRMGTAIPKTYLPLAGMTVLEQTLARITALIGVSGIVLALAKDDTRGTALTCDKPLWRVTGGAERSDSVRNALDFLADRAVEDDWVLVHDAARPCVRCEDMQRLLRTLADDPVGGLLAVPVADTLKRAAADARVQDTVERNGLWQAQTPQLFRYGLLHHALREAAARGVAVTDEAGAIEACGHRPRLIEGHADNLKITRPDDLLLAGLILRAQAEERALATERRA